MKFNPDDRGSLLTISRSRIMRYAVLFLIYKMYGWSARNWPRTALVGVAQWLGIFTLFNLAAVISPFARIGHYRLWPHSFLEFFLGYSAWITVIYALLLHFKAKETAFSSASVAVYEKMGFRSWHIILYLALSPALGALGLWWAR